MATTGAAAPDLVADGEGLLEAVAAATGRPVARPVAWSREPLVEAQNMTTERIERVAGRLEDGTAFSVVAKVLRPASASPAWAWIPEAFHEEVLRTLHWLDEPRLYRCGLAEAMPAGVRMPRLLAVAEGDERLVLWLEEVPDVVPWGPDRYRRAASALGRLAGRWSGDRAAEAFGLGPRPLDGAFYGKALHEDVPRLAAEELWADPAVARAADPHLRGDLLRLVDAVPRLLDRLPSLPTGLAHGDACPSNAHEPGDGDVVLLDWSYGHVGQLGGDLGQLVAGRFESGEAGPDEVGPVAATCLAGYLEGLAAEGAQPDRVLVEQAFATHLAARSACSLLVVPADPDGDEGRRAALLRSRAALARFAVELALRHAGG